MFTLRVIDDRDNEFIVQAIKVMAEPNDTHSQVAGYSRVAWVDAHGDKDQLAYGDVYVMNENGKTVADYHIRPPK